MLRPPHDPQPPVGLSLIPQHLSDPGRSATVGRPSIPFNPGAAAAHHCANSAAATPSGSLSGRCMWYWSLKRPGSRRAESRSASCSSGTERYTTCRRTVHTIPALSAAPRFTRSPPERALVLISSLSGSGSVAAVDVDAMSSSSRHVPRANRLRVLRVVHSAGNPCKGNPPRATRHVARLTRVSL